MFRNKIENLEQISLIYTWTLQAKISHHDDAFSSVLQLEASPVEDHKLQQKNIKKEKKDEKI